MTHHLDRLILLARAIRVERARLEYPKGHPDEGKLPAFVREFEAKHGDAALTLDGHNGLARLGSLDHLQVTGDGPK